MKERYNVLKKFYMGYLICFVKKGKYYFYGDDKLIKKYFKCASINTIYVENLNIIKKKKFTKSNYSFYLSKSLLIDYLYKNKRIICLVLTSKIRRNSVIMTHFMV